MSNAMTSTSGTDPYEFINKKPKDVSVKAKPKKAKRKLSEKAKANIRAGIQRAKEARAAKGINTKLKAKKLEDNSTMAVMNRTAPKVNKPAYKKLDLFKIAEKVSRRPSLTEIAKAIHILQRAKLL